VTPIVLILQNERLYADYMEQMFIELGYSVGGAFCTAGDAKRWLVDHEPDIALIDAEVQDGDCIEPARRLKARVVPFVVYSTVTPIGKAADPLLTAGSFVKKPAQRDRIVGAITAALHTS
jgi:two-component system KDP operon response regulator KdpE